MAQWFNYTSWPYIIGESLMIFAFTFFYVAVVFNSIEQADNLKKYGGFVPGIRPGTADGPVPGDRCWCG